MNSDHRDALGLLARAFGGIESQEVTTSSVDHLVQLMGLCVALLVEESMSAVSRQNHDALSHLSPFSR